MPLHQYKYSDCKALNNIVPKPKLGFHLASLKIIINDTSEGMYIEQALISKGLKMSLTLIKTKLYWRGKTLSLNDDKLSLKGCLIS